MIKIRNIIIAILFITTILTITACVNDKNITGEVVKEKKELQKVSVRLPIPIVDAAFAPFYSAIDQGYFEEEGLDVKLFGGTAHTNPIKMVATGTDEFGVIGGPDTLLIARPQNHELTAIGIIHKDSNFPVLLTLKDSNITEIQQLEEKKIGMFYGHLSTDILRNLFRKTGVQVKEVDVGFNYNPLITGQVDAIWAFRTTAGLNLPAQGIELNTINPADYGIQTHGHTVFTTQATIEKNPELVQRFTNAIIKGINFTLQNPDKALDSVMTRDKQLNRELEAQRLSEDNIVTSHSKTNGLTPLYMDLSMFEETYQRLLEEDIIKKDIDLKKIFTTKFIK